VPLGAANLIHNFVFMNLRPEEHDAFDKELWTPLENRFTRKNGILDPLLLHLFNLRSQDALSDTQLAEAIQLLSGFILRRFVCGAGSRGYGQLFVKACALAGAWPVESLKSYLMSKDHPDDERFKKAFVSFNVYGSTYGRFILESLEAARGHREPADLSEAQVEHIMPQTLSPQWRRDLGAEADRIFATWLHTPGNLTLSAYNQELWNRTFSEKRVECARSNIGITRELARSEHWSEAEIRLRGEAMANVAAEIWHGPREPVAATAIDEPSNGQQTSVREFNPEDAPNLFHSQIIEGCFGPTSVSNWKQLVDCAMKTALQQGTPISFLAEIANVREHEPRDRSFHQVEGTHLWLQGVDANQCWRRSLFLARRTGTAIMVQFRWPHTPGATHPGVEAVMRWSPSPQR
jgi:hypothetical protein